MDRDNTLRRALADSLSEGAQTYDIASFIVQLLEYLFYKQAVVVIRVRKLPVMQSLRNYLRNYA